MFTTMNRLFFILICLSVVVGQKYKPNWESLESRPLPPWFDDSKIGLLITWGVYSVPSIYTEWFWYAWKTEKIPEVVDFMNKFYPPDFTYADFAPMFTAEFYNPDQWADIFKASGAKYVVLITKQPEGFCNWPSKQAFNWNSMDVGPNRDLVGELERSIRNRTDIHFGLYYCLLEWYHPLYLKDKANGFRTQSFVESKVMPELHDIVNRYKPDIVWSDGNWEADDQYWNATNFLAWLYNESPVKDKVVVNDRWGNNTQCKHGGFFDCDDKYDPGKLQKRKWEEAREMDKYSWGFRRRARIDDYLSINQLLTYLARTVSCGGNFLLNVGPTKDGVIPPVQEERLRQMGAWLSINGEAIYGSEPWSHQNDTIAENLWYTAKYLNGRVFVYAIMLDWPKTNTLVLGAPVPSPSTTVSMLGYQGNFTWKAHPGGGMEIQFPVIPINQMPNLDAWTLKITGLTG
ncbi:alpha-L-fucosidase-like [Saccostrea echinata]|uniref:alpha-L-fucosidase-like n=1 Tax=Saccostrea echinata TaxID=191078 RepID=UPI002A8159DB|nr:alpha-L-fucosidase-like [Saccostrea echinata]XP_061177916.1 alpha-L-fucosidase-like [Saccostrea echinata]